MAKFTVESIEYEAKVTKESYRGQRGKNIASNRYGEPLNIRNIRIYIEKVLFLCNQIKKLKAK